MHRPLLVVLAAIQLLACGGGTNASDPTSACKSYISDGCDKLFQCNPTVAAQAYANAAACTAALSSACTSQNTGCPSGTSYNASNANTCINDLKNQSCTEFNSGNPPNSCSASKLCT